MKNTHILFASAALLFAGCANDEFTGDKGLSNDSAPIAFYMQTGAQTRATSSGSEAAGKLGNEFIVWGEKNETSGDAASDGNLVFKNYRVNYVTGTAFTTLSNTKDWEYVGITPYEDSKVSPSIYEDADTKQTIKYWDLSATSYTFTAVSAKQKDITDGLVKITKTENGADAQSKGYTIEVKSGASAGDIYVADRLNFNTKQTETIDRTKENQYGGLVKLSFRNFQTKIRFGMYETIPGYKVKVNSVTFNGTASTSNFGVDGKFVTTSANTKYTVTYDANNKAVVALDGTGATTSAYLQGGTNIIDAAALGTASTDDKVTYDKADKGYTAILPNPSNATNMKFTISYTLISEDTGEKIEVKDKTAEVPAKYCQWKSNYAYTYIFKITDSSAELYPITFDAVVEQDEVGNQETITTVTEPSITTFATDASGNVITGQDEYAPNNVIYASVVEGNAVVTLADTNVKLYTVTTTNATNFPITEASVANAVKNSTAKEVQATEVTTGIEYVTSVPAEDGTTRTLSALKWTAGATGTVYAVEYTNTTSDNKTYKIVRIK